MFFLMLRSSEEMVSFMRSMAEETKVVETREILARFTTDVISSCAFGIDTDSIKNPEAVFRKMGKKIFEPSFWSSLRISVLFMLPKLARTLKVRTEFEKDEEKRFKKNFFSRKAEDHSEGRVGIFRHRRKRNDGRKRKG